MYPLPDVIKNLRIMHGYSLRELGDKLGCSPNTLSNWEKGIGSPKMQFVQAMCKLYNISPNQFFGIEQYPELEFYMETNKQILEEIEDLQKQKTEIEKKIKSLQQMIT